MLNAVQPGPGPSTAPPCRCTPTSAAMARAAADEAVRRPAGSGGSPGHGARHVRHRQLPAGFRPCPGARDRGGALGRHRRLPHGRVRRGGPGPPGGLPALDPRAHCGAGPPEGCLLRRGPGRRRGGVPSLQPSSCACTRSTCAASGSGENGHLAFNDPPVADFADPLDVKVVELEPACRLQQVNEGHFPGLDDCPGARHHRDDPGPAAGRPRPGRRPRGPQGRAGGRRADRPDHDRRAPPRRCGRSPTPPSTSSPTRPACSPTEGTAPWGASRSPGAP